MKNINIFRIRVILAVAMSAIFLSACSNVSKQQKLDRTEGITKLESGDYQGAIESLEKALDGSAGTVGKFQLDVLKYRAEAEYMSEDYAAAAHTYEILLQVDKKSAEYYFLNSMSLSMQVMEQQADAGLLDKAKENYNNGLAKASSSKDADKVAGEETALFLLGEAYESKGMQDEAEKLYKQALVNADKSRAANIYNSLGICKMTSKEFDSALEYFEQGVAADTEGNIPGLWFNRAVACEYSGDFDRARELFNEYIDHFGDDEEAKRELDFLNTR